MISYLQNLEGEANFADPLMPDWYRGSFALPDGIQRVIIQGLVEGRGSSVMVDDIELGYCDDLSNIIIIL